MNVPLPPSRRSNIAPFMAMDVLRDAKALERAGRSIIHMELGEPGAPRRAACARPPRERCATARSAMARRSATRRCARASRAIIGERYGVDVTPDRVIVTTGSSGGFLLAFLAAFDPGARIAVTAPGYPAYANILSALGLEPVLLEIGEETRFAPTAAMLEAAHRRRQASRRALHEPGQSDRRDDCAR